MVLDLSKLCFEKTDAKTIEMVRRYLKCFDSKLLLFAHQVVDFCEKINGEEIMAERLSDENSPTSLHFCLDKFLMNVLKNFLQSIDEGFADIIDELEDGCIDDQTNQAAQLKRAIIEFQQLSFERRENYSMQMYGGKEDHAKNSFAWFDSFFGDVTSLLKNPIDRNSYHMNGIKEEEGSISPISRPLNKSSEVESKKGNWTIKEKVCVSPGRDIVPPPGLDMDTPESNKNDISLEFQWEKKQLSETRQELSVAASEDLGWKVNFSNEDYSSTKSAKTKSKKKKSVDLTNENLTFDEIFNFENFEIDGTSRVWLMKSFFRCTLKVRILFF